MSLTIGRAPFSPDDRPPMTDPSADRVLVFDDAGPRIRVVLGDRVVADTESARLLHETGTMLSYYVPREDVDHETLERSDATAHDELKGPAQIWTARAGGKEAVDAVRAWTDPPDAVSAMADYLTFEFGAFEFYAEDEHIGPHPRDPYHRIDVRRSSRHVRVQVAGELVAESTRPRIMYESSLPPRYYLPRADVRGDLLTSSTLRTQCPYKGTASYWHVDLAGDRHENVFWSYEKPRRDAADVEGRLSFVQGHDDLELEVE